MNCIGIDLGTCLSSAAVIGENGKPAAIRIDTGSSSFIGDSYSIPSSVFIEEDGSVLLWQAADKAVISHPTNFAGHKKEFIKKSALQAGFSQVELIDEPTAAAIYYSSKEKIENG